MSDLKSKQIMRGESEHGAQNFIDAIGYCLSYNPTSSVV